MSICIVADWFSIRWLSVLTEFIDMRISDLTGLYNWVLSLFCTVIVVYLLFAYLQVLSSFSMYLLYICVVWICNVCCVMLYNLVAVLVLLLLELCVLRSRWWLLSPVCFSSWWIFLHQRIRAVYISMYGGADMLLLHNVCMYLNVTYLWQVLGCWPCGFCCPSDLCGFCKERGDLEIKNNKRILR